MKYYFEQDDIVEMSQFIVKVERCDDEGCYHVFYANDLDSYMPLTDTSEEELESILEVQVIRGQSRLFDLLNEREKGVSINKFLKVTPILSCAAGYLQMLQYDDMNFLLPYMIGAFAFHKIGEKYMMYSNSRVLEIIKLSNDLDYFLKRIKYKYELADFVYHSPAVRDFYGEMPFRYQELCSMIDEGRNPFNLIEEDNVMISRYELDNLIDLYQSTKDQEVVYEKRKR